MPSVSGVTPPYRFVGYVFRCRRHIRLHLLVLGYTGWRLRDNTVYAAHRAEYANARPPPRSLFTAPVVSDRRYGLCLFFAPCRTSGAGSYNTGTSRFE